jgi:hypothetical protein
MAPSREICLLVHPFVHPHTWVNTLYCLQEWRGEQRILPPGDKINPWGTTSPLGSKFAPRSEVKNWPLPPSSVSGGSVRVCGPVPPVHEGRQHLRPGNPIRDQC